MIKKLLLVLLLPIPACVNAMDKKNPTKEQILDVTIKKVKDYDGLFACDIQWRGKDDLALPSMILSSKEDIKTTNKTIANYITYALNGHKKDIPFSFTCCTHIFPSKKKSIKREGIKTTGGTKYEIKNEDGLQLVATTIASNITNNDTLKPFLKKSKQIAIQTSAIGLQFDVYADIIEVQIHAQLYGEGKLQFSITTDDKKQLMIILMN